MIRKYVLPVVALGLLAFAMIHVVKAQQALTPPAPPIDPSRAMFTHSVAGAGIVEARSENIAIATPLPGIVVCVYVDVGREVAAGDPLFRLDDRALQADKKVKAAAVDHAAAQLIRLIATPRAEEGPVKEARVREAQANLADQEDLLRRAEVVFRDRAIGEEELNRRRQAKKVAEQQLASAEADYALWKDGAWVFDKLIAQAALNQAHEQLDQVETDLRRLTVRAPIAGRVLQMNVRPGEYAGTPPNQTLVLLGDTTVFHVRVDIDEHDIPRFQPGADAYCTLRGHPEMKYPLEFVRVEPFVLPKKSLTGDNTERVDTRVLQVIYALEAKAGVYAGQQVEVSINAGK